VDLSYRHTTVEREEERRHCYIRKENELNVGDLYPIEGKEWTVVWKDHLADEKEYLTAHQGWGKKKYSPPFKKRDVDDKIGPKFEGGKSYWWIEIWDDGYIWDFWYNAMDDAYHVEVCHTDDKSNAKSAVMKRVGRIPGEGGIDVVDMANIDANAYRLMEELK